MRELMLLLIAHEPQVHYPPHDVRGALDLATFRMSEQQLERVLEHGGQVQADCSELVTEICRWAGTKDPSGLGYHYPGTTWSMGAHLPHYADGRKALTGALALFMQPAHVCMVLEPDSKKGNPFLFSHGQERGPLKIRLSEERKYHPGPVVFLSIAGL